MFISRLRRPDIEVYDSTTFNFKRRMEVNGMTKPKNIVSCAVNNCLYVSDVCYQRKSSAILRINPTDGNLIKTWNINGCGGRLSIASDTNVILNMNLEAKVQEYTAYGKLIRIINLDSVRTSIFRSWHAVKLDSGLFVVCHGSHNDVLGRVCLLSIKTTTSTPGRTDDVQVVKVFIGRKLESNRIWREPTYLSVDKEGLILVSDVSCKAVLLSSNLDEPQILVSGEDGMKISWRTCFVESTGRWFVAD